MIDFLHSGAFIVDPLTTTLAEEARFSLLLAVSLPPQLVPLLQNHGTDCLLHDFSWVSVSVQRTPPSPSTLLRWPRLAFGAPSSCSGNFGSWPVSSLLIAHPEIFADCRRQVSSSASAPTSLSKTLVASLGVFNLVRRSSPPSSSAVVSSFVPSPLVG